MTTCISNLMGNTGLKYLLVLAFLICLLPVGAMAIVYVDSPMVIEEPGEYQLIKDITDYDGVRWQNGSSFYEPCIKILASDVIFDGNGHTISTGVKFNSSSDDQVGIYVEAQLERVSVIDTKVDKFNYGIYYYVVNPFSHPESGGRIDNNNVNNNDYGIVLDSSQWVSVLNNDASYTKKQGITVSASHWNTINNNSANNNGNVGISVEGGSRNNTVTQNSANFNKDIGVYVKNSYNNLVQSNTANDNINTSTSGAGAFGNGILLEESTGNHIINNDAHRNRRSGITVIPMQSSIPNWIENNSVSENGHSVGSTPYGWGIFVGLDSGKTHVNNNHAFDNTAIGIELQQDNGADSTGNLVEGNGVMGILLSGSKNNILHDNIVRNNHKYGVQLATFITDSSVYLSSDSNSLINNTIYGHEISGVYLNGTDNFEPLIKTMLDGNDIYNNGEWGVQLYHSNLNTLKNNIIHANERLGIKLDGSGYNVIYNNIFNNTINAGFGQQSNNPNTWNVLQEPGQNIVGGPYKGGNYWAQPDGHGWSQINFDTKGNGFCDNAFAIGPSNIDNFPLTNSLKVSFTADKTSGDAPLTVKFNGNVTGQTGNQWLWNFGDYTTDTTQNPTHVYQNNGVYTVSLTASNGGWSNTTTKTGFIMVGIASPVADFSGTPVTGSFPLTVTFTDLSAPNSGQYAVTAWDWNFGDNTPHSNFKSPVHVYQAAGNYNVTLTVTNPGSSNTTSKVNYITSGSTPAPSAAFTMNPTTGPFPLSVNFIDQSAGSPTLTWDWDFGDNSTHSTLQNPNHVYLTEDTYSITLTVSNVGGQSQITHDVIVTSPAAPTAAFTMNPSSGPFPLTVNFIDQSTGLFPLTYNWEFGDGYTDTVQNPSYEYGTPGTYHVNLTVSNVGGLSQVTHDIVVTNPASPTAAFTMNPTSGPFPLTVNFIDQSTGTPPLTYSWDFGDGVTSNEQNPSYEYDTPGTYHITLTVSNAGGPSVPVTHDIFVGGTVQPTAAFAAVPPSGTVPLLVSFVDQSAGGPVSWSWDFGDGATSTERTPTHVYTTSSTTPMVANLTVTNEGGSTSVSHQIAVNPPSPVSASFAIAPPTSWIEPVELQFVDTSTGGPTSWYWDFNDPTASTPQKTSSLQSPKHIYANAGNYTPTLTVSNSLGINTKIYEGVIYIRHTPPVAAFSASPTTGTAPFSVTFTDQSVGQALQAWDWNFGDGGTSQTQSPVYTFNTPGTYSVTFKSYNDGGWSAPVTKPALITVLAAPPIPTPNIIRLYNGWNFVSVPKELAVGQNTAGVVFAGVNRAGHSILLYNAQTGMWSQVASGDKLKPLDGIWIYSGSTSYQDITLTFEGGIIIPPSKQVYTGWNAIGFTGTNQASARDYLLSLGTNWTSVIGYHAGATPDITIIRGSTDPVFSDSRPMYPTHGYWLSMTSPGTLHGMV